MRFWQQLQTTEAVPRSSKLNTESKQLAFINAYSFILFALCSKGNLLITGKTEWGFICVMIKLPLGFFFFFFAGSLIISCIWQVKPLLIMSVCSCVSVHLSVFAYPGIYSVTDIRPQWWWVSSSSSLAQTPALMRLPSAGWMLSYSRPLCAALCRPRTSLPIVSCSQIKLELISQLAQLLVPPCQRPPFSSAPHPTCPVLPLWDHGCLKPQTSARISDF